MTVFDKSARKDGTFSRDDFSDDHGCDVYHCPSGAIQLLGTWAERALKLVVRNERDLSATTRLFLNHLRAAGGLE